MNVEFIWLPFEKELPFVCKIPEAQSIKDHFKKDPFPALKKYLAKLFNVPLRLCDVKRKVLFGSSEEGHVENKSKTPLFMFYSEYLFRLYCVIEVDLPSHDESALCKKFQKIIKLFCSKQQDESIPNLWMNIDVSSFVTNPLKTIDFFTELKSFSLGNIVKLNTFIEHFSSESSLKPYNYKITQVKVKFMHDEQRMHLFFVVGKNISVKKRTARTHCIHKLIVPYSCIHTILICDEEDISVYFRLYKAPLLYAVEQKLFDENDCEEKDYISFLEISSMTSWIRTLNLFEECPPSIRKNFSMNSVVKITFQGKDYNEIYKIMLHHKNVQMYFSWMNEIPYKPVQHPFQFNFKTDEEVKSKELNFECSYASQCLLTLNFEVLDHLMHPKELQSFKMFLKTVEHPRVLCDVFYLIHSAICQCHVILFNYSVQTLYQKMSMSESVDYGRDKKIIFVKRAILGPTHVFFLPPAPILKSRTLRECNPGYSMRISIRDVNFETINFSFKAFSKNKKELMINFFNNYYKSVMLKGIKIEKRIYCYVGSSTSQLRGHGLWFYAEDSQGKNAETIRKEIGNMDKIKQVPKFMARMGQTFSQALDCIMVPKKFTNIEKPDKDITGGVKQFLNDDDFDDSKKKFLKEIKEEGSDMENKEPYTFSDGIGRISMEIAEEVYKKLHLEDKQPCAMQIRYAGCKGMLVVDPNLEGKQILFRESMKKFESSSEYLEILKLSDKRAAFLNRPLITILEQLGVPKDAFVKLQKDMIQNHIRSMFHEADACKFLNRNSQIRFDFLGMHKVGIRFTEDPLFRSMIYGLFRKQLDLLKTKANIEIPSNKGRAMFGVLDETFTLEYGQVFIQYSDWYTDEPVIVTGTVVVTKNPCMHPGDVRKFEAVDVEKLHHICDCIVFPAKGPRPHPDEMAGSDLDGDEYHVIWLTDLFFDRENENAMNYAMPKDKQKDFEGSIKPADELDHLCSFIVHSNVGLIANAHLVFADWKKEGIFSENCIRLANKYAIALDFAKSGIPATQDHKDFAINFPDFMQKLGEKNTYISKKSLGVLYRNCKCLEMGLETSKSEVQYRVDEDLLYDNWVAYKKSAQRAYGKYCRKIEYMLNLYSFENEGELLSGAIINPPKYFEQRHDLDNLKTFLEHEMSWLFYDLQRQFFTEFDGKPRTDNYTEKMMQKASAWYAVTYMPENGVKNLYFGFPWAVFDVLMHIKSVKCIHKGYYDSNRKSLLAQIVDNSLKSHLPKLSENSDIPTIYKSRLDVLDVTRHVLLKWLKTQRDIFVNPDFKAIQKLIEKEFESVSAVLLSCDQLYVKSLKEKNKLSQAISPCYYIIETLLSVANIRPRGLQKNLQQELGLLSWVTLVKLACSYNPQYLGIADKEGNYASPVFYVPTDNITSIFKLHLFESNILSEEFSLKILREPDYVISYLKDQFKLKDIDFRYNLEKKDDYVAIFTVMGSRYAIEKLKDFIVQPDFYSWIINNKNLFQTKN